MLDIGETFAHESFDGIDRALGISYEMFFGRIADNEAVVGHGDDGGNHRAFMAGEMTRGIPLSM